MGLPENITDDMSEGQSGISVTVDADTESFSESIEEARVELEEFRDVLAEANAELAELNEALPAGSTAEIHKVGKRSYTEISRPDE
jgi:molybdopterin converting factor small subunit